MTIYDRRLTFWQWDKNQKLIVDDCDANKIFHVWNRSIVQALPVKPYLFDDKYVIDVPNVLLQYAYDIYVYEYVETETESYTALKSVFSVQSRPKPEDYIYEETKLYSIEQAVELALEQAKQSGEFDGKSAYDIAVEYGFKGTEKEWIDLISGLTNLLNSSGQYSVSQVSRESFNRAISDGSMALGERSICGRKAFYIRSIDADRKFIYLSATKVKPVFSTFEAVDEDFYIASYVNNERSFNVGDEFSIINYNHYAHLGPIVSIYHNRIEYAGELGFDTFYDDSNVDGHTINVPMSPFCGSVILAPHSIADGYDSWATGENASAFGHEVRAYGDYGHAEGIRTHAYYAGHSEGHGTRANGHICHAEGNYSEANGNVSHAEGDFCNAEGNISHAEGGATRALGEYSHSENYKTVACADKSHAEGDASMSGVATWQIDDPIFSFSKINGGVRLQIESASSGKLQMEYVVPFRLEVGPSDARTVYGVGGQYVDQLKPLGGFFFEGVSMTDVQNPVLKNSPSLFYVKDYNKTDYSGTHAEGQSCIATNTAAHAEGGETMAAAERSHAEGSRTKACGFGSHVEGVHTYTSLAATFAHAEGGETQAFGERSHAEGSNTVAHGKSSHAEGSGTSAFGESAHAEGNNTTADAAYSHAEGKDTVAFAERSHAEGNGTYTNGYAAHAEGNGARATGSASHAEGQTTNATNSQDHAEGLNTTASGGQSHAEGSGSNAKAWVSHAEGLNTTVEGWAAHAEGRETSVAACTNWNNGGAAAHAEGYQTKALHPVSHVEGEGTRSSRRAQHVEGQYNADEATAYHITGCGTSDTNRKNCLSYGVENNEAYIKVGAVKITESQLTRLLQLLS